MPDFKMQQNSFPIASVIQAAQQNAQRQLDARTQGQQSLIAGLQSIGQVGESIYNQKMRIAQAMAGAKQYAQTPEGQQVLGTNTVTTSPMGQPVTHNQTAAYDPPTGSVTPNQSPVSIQDIAKSMEGMAPKDIFENLRETKKLSYEPQKIAIEGRKAAAEEENNKIQRLIQGMLAQNTIKNEGLQRTQAAENAAFEADKEMSKHYLANPFLAADARKRMANKTSTLPEVGKTVTHSSGVKITRTK